MRLTIVQNRKLDFYLDLTEKQRAVYGNGCGPKFLWLDKLIPELCFTSACRHHDFNYDIGGNEKDRKQADDYFLGEMITLSWSSRCVFFAYVYHRAVRIFGYFAFNRGKYLTKEQLYKLAWKKYKLDLKKYE